MNKKIKIASQALSYLMVIGLVSIMVVLTTESVSLSGIAVVDNAWWINPLLIPAFVVFVIAASAIAKISPFNDINYKLKGSGFYKLLKLLLILLFSVIAVFTLLGSGGYIAFTIKTIWMLALFFVINNSLPNYRYDQAISLAWDKLVPFSLIWIIIIACCILYLEQLAGG